MNADDELEKLLRSSGIEINEEDTQEQVVEKVAEPKKEIKLISPKEKEIVDFFTLIDNQTVLLKKIKETMIRQHHLEGGISIGTIFSLNSWIQKHFEDEYQKFVNYFCLEKPKE